MTNYHFTPQREENLGKHLFYLGGGKVFKAGQKVIFFFQLENSDLKSM